MGQKNKKTESWERKYYGIAHNDIWKKYSESEYTKRSVDYIRENVSSPGKVLEVGCGLAGFADVMPDGVFYTGVDSSEYAVSAASARLAESGATVFLAEAGELPFEDESFDFVFAKYALEHFSEPKKAIEEMVRVLKEGGTLLLNAPNLELPFSYPSAVRHRGLFYRLSLHFVRMFDYVGRIFGVFSFRTLEENYLQSTGKYELPDDDLVYLVSSYEVIETLKRLGLVIVHAETFKRSSGLKNSIKRVLVVLPTLKYYGAELFVIANK